MKSITSAGGPYVILDREVVHTWGANVHKTFSSPNAPFASDYETAGALTCGVLNPPCYTAKLNGHNADALLISMPFEIAVFQSHELPIFLAQIEYAEPDWSFHDLCLEDFTNTRFKDDIFFSSKDATYTLFDSAYLPSEIGEDCLNFSLVAGGYRLSTTYSADHEKGLFLYKIDRANFSP